MRLTLLATTAALVAGLGMVGLIKSGASAPRDPFRQGLDGSRYATDRPVDFSIRSTLVRWLGGLPMADAGSVRASAQDAWWGENIPVVPSHGAEGTER